MPRGLPSCRKICSLRGGFVGKGLRVMLLDLILGFVISYVCGQTIVVLLVLMKFYVNC
ncbi:hypothetical protein HanRHA438_Chr14g0668101 [Helianthus annuus]|nr:hypothetical protein HanRHA438_Chr14g0668101 [Helianthus annuus]